MKVSQLRPDDLFRSRVSVNRGPFRYSRAQSISGHLSRHECYVSIVSPATLRWFRHLYC
ncbi:hypothetical protein QL093DRAFT_2240100 [Fusarium oxysporum]|nr:hypothetical protein QL093DRAFT_2240100 [Fusarium oxysporum]